MSNQGNDTSSKPQAGSTNSTAQPETVQPVVKPATTIKPNDKVKMPTFHRTFENDQTKKK